MATELGELCRQRGIHFHIDGAQTWGAVATNLRAIGCDSFSASAHKWFLGPKEVGLLFVREEAQGQAHIDTLATRLKEGLREAGMQLVTPMSREFSAGVCIAAVAPDSREALFERLYREYGIAGAPTGGLRLCPHIYNTAEHVDRAIAGVRAMRA